MQARKLEFSREVLAAIRHLSKQVFNAGTDEELKRIFGIDHAQLEGIMNKITEALPDVLFEKKFQPVSAEMKNICAREFLFFQLQERWDDPRYQENLSNFITIFSRDITQQITKTQKIATREE